MTPPSLDALRPTWAEINLDALTANLAAVRERVGDVPILGVVKADAYGHGAVPVARALEHAGVASLGVALPEEGMEIRRAGVRAPILLMGGFTPPQAGAILEHDLIPAVYRLDQLQALSAAAERRGARAGVHIKVDTGMSRLGVPAGEIAAFASALKATPGVDPIGVFSHLAVAGVSDNPFTTQQLALFRETIETLAEHGVRPPAIHLANSAAVIDHPPAWLTLVRPGIALYGYPTATGTPAVPLHPVLSLLSRIIQLREIDPGSSVGYGRTWVARRKTRVATLPIGYDDGVPFHAGNRGHVLVRGRRAPIIGRINMDLTTIAVTDIPDAAVGDPAVICGADGPERIGADRIAEWAGTHVWDVLCGIGSRVPRVYLQNGRRTVASRFVPPLV